MPLSERDEQTLRRTFIASFLYILYGQYFLLVYVNVSDSLCPAMQLCPLQDVSSLNLSASSEAAFLFRHSYSKLECHMNTMSLPVHSPAASAFQMTAELAWASWETVVRRTLMMAQSTCSPAEYQRMLDEKTAAALEIGELLFSPNGASVEALLAPWHSRATANARRLRS